MRSTQNWPIELQLGQLNIIFRQFKIQKNVSKQEQIYQLEQESIKTSINNLFSFPFVKKAIDENNLLIHALLHDIGSGNLKFLNPVTEYFENF